jgi:hypothetical protein
MMMSWILRRSKRLKPSELSAADHDTPRDRGVSFRQAADRLWHMLWPASWPTRHHQKNQIKVSFVLLALASSEASAFAFVCQAVGVRSRAWGRSFYVVEAKLAALHRCARRSGICTISYCVPGY